MGAQFTKECGGGTCKYRSKLWSPDQQVRYYVESVDGERVFCVKNYRTGQGACANQDTDEVVYLRKVGANDRWLKGVSLPKPPGDSLASADFHKEASQKDAVKRSGLANHSSVSALLAAWKRSREHSRSWEMMWSPAWRRKSSGAPVSCNCNFSPPNSTRL